MRSVCVLFFLAAAAVASLAACSSTPERLRPAELSEIKSAVTLRTVWSVSLGAAKGAPLQPVVLENAVYAAAANGTIVRVAPDSGRIVWQIDADVPISAGVGSDGALIAVASRRGELLTFDVEGKPKWRASLSSDVAAPPLVGRGLVIVRSTDHRVSAFDAQSGKRLWIFDRAQPSLTLRAPVEMAFAGDNVLVGLPSGRVVALALSNGAARWEATVSEPRGTTEVERLSDVVGPVVVNGRDACAASFQGRVVCVDPSSGTPRWTRELSAGGGPAFDDTRVLAVSSMSHVSAFTRDGGANLWRNDKLANRALTTPLVLKNGVLAGDMDGYLHVFSLGDGELIGRERIDRSAVIARPQRWADQVIVQTQDGTLAMLSLGR